MVNGSIGNKVIAAFTSFNPEIGLFRDALESVVSQVDRVIIVDNGSRNISDIQNLADETRSLLISFHNNRGVAAAYNSAFSEAANLGAEWVLTCDQDSVMPNDMVYRLFQGASDAGVGHSIGIICPNFRNRTTGQAEHANLRPKIIDACISSGSLTLVSAWKEISGFDEEMFIDGVDFEFCDRLNLSGYCVLLIPDINMDHEIGTAELHSFMGHRFSVLNHSAFRKYYIAQNILYRDGKLRGGAPSTFAFLKILKQELLVLVYENDKIKKTKSIFLGTRSGIKLLREMKRRND